MISIISFTLGLVYVYTIYVEIVAIELTFLFFSFECVRFGELYSLTICPLYSDAIALTP